jgi:hypothetical protein
MDGRATQWSQSGINKGANIPAAQFSLVFGQFPFKKACFAPQVLGLNYRLINGTMATRGFKRVRHKN